MINPFKSKKGLGRGLSSLIGDSDIKTSSNKISISSIVPNKNQPRKNFEKSNNYACIACYNDNYTFSGRHEVRNKMASDLARQNLIAAREAGDYTKEEEARQALTKLDLEAERIRVTKSKKEQEYEAYQKELKLKQWRQRATK